MTSLTPSFFNGSCSFLQATRTSLKSWMSLNIGYIPPPTTELAALECLKIDAQCCDHSCVFIFDCNFFILAGNQDNHKSFNEFEFWPHHIIGYGVRCPWAFWKIPIDLQWEKQCDYSSALFLNESSSFLLVTTRTIKAWSSLNFGYTQPPTTELAAHEHFEKSRRLTMWEIAPSFFMWSSFF